MITALTAQNTKGVTGIHDVPPEFIAAQIDAVFSDLDVDAVKIGMLSQRAVDRGGRGRARPPRGRRNVVLDPVMVATSGDRLLAPDAIDALRARAHSRRALVITPNLPEAAALLDAPIADRRSGDARRRRERLLALGAKAVLIKGGHGSGAESVDLLVDADGVARLRRAAHRHAQHARHRLHAVVRHRGRPRQGPRPRATPCATPRLTSPPRSPPPTGSPIGRGHGPVHHFHAWW